MKNIEKNIYLMEEKKDNNNHPEALDRTPFSAIG